MAISQDFCFLYIPIALGNWKILIFPWKNYGQMWMCSLKFPNVVRLVKHNLFALPDLILHVHSLFYGDR